MRFEPPPRPVYPSPVADERKTTLVHARAVADAKDVDPMLGAVLESRYKILRQLGSGGMSTVYLAQNLSFDGHVAVKFIRPRITSSREAMSRCMLEAKALASIPSNFIVRAHDVRTLPNGQIYIVMEYLEGEDLGALLRREGKIPWRRAAKMIRMICAGLAAAHKRQLLHRDIKPQNCFRVTLDEDPDHIKLIDFGIAKDVTADHDITETGLILGTPDYMAPELMDERCVPDHRSDLYAVGITLYKLLTGTVPFTGRSAFEICARHANDPVIPPSQRSPALGIPPAADLVVLRALAKDPAQRYQTALDMIRDIEASLARTHTGPLPVITTEDLGASPSTILPTPANSTRRPFARVPPRIAAPSAHTHPLRIAPAPTPDSRPIDPDPLAPPDLAESQRPRRRTNQYISPGSSSGPSLPIPLVIEPATPPVRVVRRREVLAKLLLPLASALIFGLTTRALAVPPPAPRPLPESINRTHDSPPLSPPARQANRTDPTTPAPTTQAATTPTRGTTTQGAPTPAPTTPEPTKPDKATPTVKPERPPPSPETGFNYRSAKKILKEQKSFIRNTCLVGHGEPDKISIHIVVRKDGEVLSVNPDTDTVTARECLEKLVLNTVFPNSPHGGAFIYYHPAGSYRPTPLPALARGAQ
jgi:serine/threonine protein kinase